MNRKLKMGMVGGGRGAFIGAVHRMAAQLDGLIELSCGAFSADPEKSKATGKDLFLPDSRVYASYQELIEKESRLPEGQRMDFVSIVTPNHLHFPVAKLALEHGFHVMCEKPMTFNYEEALQLNELVKQSGLLFGLTHNYTGYPMVKEARSLVSRGELGSIRKVVVEYPQGWLATRLEESGQKQASWRTNPAEAGASCCIGDIGTHAGNLAEYITGLRIEEVCADLTTFVDGRSLDDDGNVLVRFDNGAKGVLYASQISVDEENGLSIRVYGDKGGIEWHQEEPNSLVVKWMNRPREIRRTGVNYGSRLSAEALVNTRLPCGHPEGYLEAFANLYKNFALNLIHRKMKENPPDHCLDYPKSAEGVRGMAFINSVLASSKSKEKWVRLPRWNKE